MSWVSDQADAIADKTVGSVGDAVQGYFADIASKFWAGFDDLALLAMMVCAFMWMMSVPKMGKLIWLTMSVYVVTCIIRVAV